MKRYIRTKDGKIIDLKNREIDINARYDIVFEDNTYISGDDILKQADIIDELIEAGDLIRAFATLDEVIRVSENIIEAHSHYLEYGYVYELYTKQGNDYILVAKIENGKWRVI